MTLFDSPDDRPPDRIADPRQSSLFPDNFEARANALQALAELEPGRALACVVRAREAGLVGRDIDELERAVRWLASRIARGTPSVEIAAQIFLAVPGAFRNGTITFAAAQFLDEALAAYGLRHRRSEVYVDFERRVPTAALHIVRGNHERAHVLLHSSVRLEDPLRADLWSYLGDARMALRDEDGARECFVRALLLDAQRVDLHRCKAPKLTELYGRLCAAHPEPRAREMLFTEAWLAGVLPVRPSEGLGLDLALLLRPSATDLDGEPHARWRRFSRLWFADRSRTQGSVDLEARQELEALDPELFRRCMVVARRGALLR